MTRKEIIDEGYKVDEDGTIQSPGKFEGEPIYAVYFYYLMMDGRGDTEYPCDEENCEAYSEDGCMADECPLKPISVFQVSTEDLEEFPELKGVKEVRLTESDQGFVYLEIIEEKKSA